MDKRSAGDGKGKMFFQQTLRQLRRKRELTITPAANRRTSRPKPKHSLKRRPTRRNALVETLTERTKFPNAFHLTNLLSHPRCPYPQLRQRRYLLLLIRHNNLQQRESPAPPLIRRRKGITQDPKVIISSPETGGKSRTGLRRRTHYGPIL